MDLFKKIKSIFNNEKEEIKKTPVVREKKKEVKHADTGVTLNVPSELSEEKKVLTPKEEKHEKEIQKKGPIPEILLRPIITEKATVTATYVFEVLPSATKREVYKAIERLYGITPESVRIRNVSGKAVRWNYRQGQRKNVKRAIVKLPKGKTIDVYEGT